MTEDKLNTVIEVNGKVIAELGANEKNGNTKVGMSLGKTINLGNYESIRVDVTVDTHVAAGDIDIAYDAVSKYTKARFYKEVQAIEGKK